MGKENIAELAIVKWEDCNNTGWHVKQCTVSIGFCVTHQVDADIYEMNESEIKRHIQNKSLERLDRDVKSALYPEIQEVIDELQEFVYCLREVNIIDPSNQLFFKGEPLYHVLERFIDKLS